MHDATRFISGRPSIHVLAIIVVAFLLLATSLLALPRAAAEDTNATLVVDDDHVQCPQAQFTTIQGAVVVASSTPGTQTIRVCAGTYNENVVIGPVNSLNLLGDGATKVFVRGVPDTPGPIIDVTTAGQVVVRGMTIDGGAMMAGPTVWGIRFMDTDGEISDVAVLHVRDATGGSQGIAIRAERNSGSSHVMIKHNLVRDYTRVGISANGQGVDVRITDNTVIGPDLPKVWAPNGIQVSRGATARIQNNKVSGSTSPVPDAGAGSGILLFCAGAARVTENRVFASDLGIAVSDNSFATVSRNRVENSLFDAYSLQYIGKLFGDLGCPSFPSPTKDNVLSDNRARNNGQDGISLANYDPVSDATSPSDNTISRNDVQGSGIDGIVICGSKTGPSGTQCDGTGGNPSGNLITKNRIRASALTDPTGVDARDETTGSGTAGTANTWRDNRCKTSSPDGLCSDSKENEDWHSFGTEERAKDPKDSSNGVARIDTSDPESFGALTRDLNSKVPDLTGHLSLNYLIVPIELGPVPSLLGGPTELSRGCGGGPTRFELAIDLNGDGISDGDAVGYIGPAPTFTGCAQNTWQYQSLTDDGLRWDLTQLGGLPVNSWATVVGFFAGYPSHVVLSGTLVDDSALLPALGGLAYYDSIEIGNQTLADGL